MDASGLDGLRKKLKPPAVMLADDYDDQDVRGWWMSEKLDGVRTTWNTKNFVSRYGNVFNAPAWFTEDLPKGPRGVPLDGELWAGRGSFQFVSGAVRRHKPRDEDWAQIKYMVFDGPGILGPFEARMASLERIVHGPNAIIVEQERVKSPKHLVRVFKATIKGGGEGLMLRAPGSPYVFGRSPLLLKVKPWYDTEGVIVGYKPGKGKYKDVVGSFKIELADGRIAYVAGMPDELRIDPPTVGTVITFKYRNLTKAGLPRHPEFLRIRQEI